MAPHLLPSPAGLLNNTRPVVSVVLEWDNPRVQNGHRVPRALAALARELSTSDGRAELLVLHPAEIDATVVTRGLEQAGIPASSGPDATLQVHVHDAGPSRYYEMKNMGACQSRGDVVVFADSDSVVQPGWLEALLAPFSDPTVDVVAGLTSPGPVDTLLERAVALFWLFDPPRPADGLQESTRFHANNVAFRRSCLERYPFPDMPGRFRGQCQALARQLGDDGVTIWLNPAAHSVHPPPDGLAGLLRRGMADGLDHALDQRARGEGVFHGLLVSAPRRVGRRLRLHVGRVRTRRAQWHFGRLGDTAGLLAAALYDLAALVGVLIGRLRPGAARHWT
jgi:hypothetical protein